MSFAKLSAGLSSLAKEFAAPPPPSSHGASTGAPPVSGPASVPVSASGPQRPLHQGNTAVGNRAPVPRQGDAALSGPHLSGLSRPLSHLEITGLVAGGNRQQLACALVGGERLTSAAEAGAIKLSWFRVRDGGHFAPLSGISSPTYLPVLDDIGSRLMVRARDTHDSDNSGFAETATLELDPAISAKAARFLERREGYFVADTARVSETLANVTQVLLGATVEVVVRDGELTISADRHDAGKDATADGPASAPLEDATAGGSTLLRLPSSAFVQLRVRVDHMPGSSGVALTYPASLAPQPERQSDAPEGEPPSQPQPPVRHVLTLTCQSIASRDVLAYVVRTLTGLDPFGRDEPLDSDDVFQEAFETPAASAGAVAPGAPAAEPVASPSSDPPARRRAPSATDAAARAEIASMEVVPSLELSSFLGPADTTPGTHDGAVNPSEELTGVPAAQNQIDEASSEGAAVIEPDSPTQQGDEQETANAQSPSDQHAAAPMPVEQPDGADSSPETPDGQSSDAPSVSQPTASDGPPPASEDVAPSPAMAPAPAPEQQPSSASAPPRVLTPRSDGGATSAALPSPSRSPSASGPFANGGAPSEPAALPLWAQVTAQSKELAAKETQLRTLGAQLAAARAQCDGLAKQLADRDAALLQATAAASKASADHARALAQAARELAKLQSQHDVASASVASKGEEIKRQATQISALSSESLAAKQRVAALTSELDALRKEAAAAKSDASAQSGGLAKLTAELRGARESLATVTKERDDAREALRQAHAQLETSRAAAAASASESSRLASEAEALRARAETAAAEREKAAAEAAGALAARNDARAAAAAAEGALTKLQLSVSGLEAEVTALRSERDGLKAAVATAQARAASAEADQRVLREAADAAGARAAVATSESGVMSSKLSEVSKSVDALAREKAEAVARASEAESEAADLRGRLAASEGKLKKFASSADQVKEMQRVIDKLQDQMDAVISEKNAASRKAESLRRDVARMTGGAEELKSMDIDKLAKAKRSLEEKVVKLTADNAALREAADAARAAAATAAPARAANLPSIPSPFPGGASVLSSSSAANGGAAQQQQQQQRFASSAALSQGSASSLSPASGSLGGHGRSLSGGSGMPSFLAPPQAFSPGGSAAGGSFGAPSAGGGSGVSHPHGSRGKPSGAAVAMKAEQLQALANGLLEQLGDKDEALAQQRAQKEMLAARIRELEAKVALLEGQRDED